MCSANITHRNKLELIAAYVISLHTTHLHSFYIYMYVTRIPSPWGRGRLGAGLFEMLHLSAAVTRSHCTDGSHWGIHQGLLAGHSRLESVESYLLAARSSLLDFYKPSSCRLPGWTLLLLFSFSSRISSLWLSQFFSSRLSSSLPDARSSASYSATTAQPNSE